MDQENVKNSRNINKERDFPATEDNFKPVFKRYKSRQSALDLSEVVDFDQFDVCSRFKVTRRNVKADVGGRICSHLGLRSPQEWQIFSLNTSPGFIFIRNPFKPGKQRYWLKRLLQDIPSPTNKSNLQDGFPVMGESIWDLHCKGCETGKKSSFSQLRWVTLGYHYNWSTKLYDPKDMSPFPEDIWILSSIVATSLGFQNFTAEAAIVNYYNMTSTLGGHNDHSELDHNAPLISFSFGQSAIFLVGGSTKAVTPTPILLRSGDIIILSSSSRLAFHGVPKIMHDDPENMTLCWGVNESMKHNKSKLEVLAEEEEVESKVSRQSKPCNMCNNEMEVSISSTEMQTESDNFSSATIQSLPVTKSRLVKDELQKKQKVIDDESEQKNKKLCSEVVSAASNRADRTDNQSQDKMVEELHTVRHNCYDERDLELHLTDENLSSVNSDVNSDMADAFFHLKVKFPHIDEILEKIRMETDRLLQNELWEPFEKHLQNTRINVSVRQMNKLD